MPLDLLEAVDKVNEAQKRVVVAKVRAALGKIAGGDVAVWGLAFKAQNDDMREAASLVFVDAVLAEGGRLPVPDPQPLHEAKRRLGHRWTYAEHRDDPLE